MLRFVKIGEAIRRFAFKPPLVQFTRGCYYPYIGYRNLLSWTLEGTWQTEAKFV